MAISSGKYDVMLVAEYGLNSPTLQPQQGWYHRICLCLPKEPSPVSVTIPMIETILSGTSIAVHVSQSMQICGQEWHQRDLIQPS